MSAFKDYLGDSVYADMTEYGNIVLTTENSPGEPSNLIVMEPAVVEAFKRYVERVKELRKERA